MTFCLNPNCPKPQNPDCGQFCIRCGWRLRLGDRYRAIQPLGSSPVNPTFAGIDEERSARCVIKQFRPHREQRDPQTELDSWQQEVTQLDRLGRHPQLPQLLGYFERDRYQYLIHEFVAGENLTQQLARNGPFSELEVRQVLVQLLPVLEALHQTGLIHRNIKPDNIIRRTIPSLKLEDSTTLVLVGFGAAKYATATSIARTGTVVGSAEYTAPEQLLGKATWQSDIYSLGVTCLHLLTQVSPFDLFDNFYGKWMWRDYLLHPVSDRLYRILDRCVAMALRERYPSAEAVLHDLYPPSVAVAISQATQSAGELMGKAGKNAKAASGGFKKWRCDRTLYAPTQTAAPTTTEVTSVIFDADSQTVATGHWGGQIQIWHLQTGELRQTLTDHDLGVLSIACHPHTGAIVSGGADCGIRVWEPISPTEFAATPSCRFGGHEHIVTTLAVTPDGGTLVSGSRDKTVKLWNFHTGEPLQTLAGHAQPVTDLAIDPGGNRLATASLDGTVKIWHLGTGELLRTLVSAGGAVYAIAITPDGRTAIGGRWDGTLTLWSLQTGSVRQTLGTHSLPVAAIALHGNTIAAARRDATVQLWHWSAGEKSPRDLPEQTLIGHARGVNAVAFDRSGQVFVSASQYGTIKLWQCKGNV